VKALTALLAGLLFGTGLLFSGMADPANVLGFFDLFGDWRPQLAFVMGGALIVTGPAFWLARRRSHAVLGEPLHLPPRVGIDAKLVAGAALFGVGWGMSGLCPGPALVVLTTGKPIVFVFVGALLVGSWAATIGAPKPAAPNRADATGAPRSAKP
jgi:uncharacterized membrane protein YedE/YeeE